MSKCPSCGVVLELTLGTNYTRTKELLDHLTGADLTNEQLGVLKWKHSAKLGTLSTLLVTNDLLNVPIARLLFDRLTTAASKSWKLDDVTYKLSSNPEGTATWMQRWQSIREKETRAAFQPRPDTEIGHNETNTGSYP